MAHPAPAYDRHALEVRAALQQYLNRTGLTVEDFAGRIGYATVTLYHFLQGRYQGNPGKVCIAITNFIGQHPIAAFNAIEGVLYETKNVQTLRRIFYDCLDKSRAAVVYGAPGSQKTFALKHLIAELNREELAGGARSAYYIYCRHGINPRQLLKRVAEACGSSPRGDTDHILRNLRFEFGNRKVSIVFDEAQHLTIGCLEVIRELLDELHCGLLLAGSHGLIQTFRRSHELEQWTSRHQAVFELPGISNDEAAHIMRSELGDVKERTLEKLIADALVPDIHRKPEANEPPPKYLSARRLFFGMTAIREQRERSRVQ